MSTYWGYVCLSHDPPIESDHWLNHGEDKLRELAPLRDTHPWVIDALDWENPTASPLKWLTEHTHCIIALQNEYGDREPITPQEKCGHSRHRYGTTERTLPCGLPWGHENEHYFGNPTPIETKRVQHMSELELLRMSELERLLQIEAAARLVWQNCPMKHGSSCAADRFSDEGLEEGPCDCGLDAFDRALFRGDPPS